MKTFNRIDWKKGMEIMPETFLYADSHHDNISRINRQMLVPFAYGLVPMRDFELKYTILDHKLTLDKIACTIMDSEGNLLNITKGVTLPLPKEVQGTYYLTVSYGEEEHVEKNGVPQVERNYKFQLINLFNPSSPLLFPIMKLRAENGEWEVLDFIPPCFSINSCNQLADLAGHCRQQITKMLELVEKRELTAAYGQIGYLLIEWSNTLSSDLPASFVTRLKKIIFVVKANHLFDDADETLMTRMDNFIWREFNPNALFETIQEALSYLHAAIAYLQEVKTEPVPVVEKPKPEPEEEELTYML